MPQLRLRPVERMNGRSKKSAASGASWEMIRLYFWSFWFHEVKFDGWRVQVHKYGRTVWLYTKSRHDCTKCFTGLSKALEAIPLPFCIIDGEVVACDTAAVRRIFTRCISAMSGPRPSACGPSTYCSTTARTCASRR
jgi:ATP dependent DNA ligase domain